MKMKLELNTTQAKALGGKGSGTSRIVLGRLAVRDRDDDLLEKGFVANLGDEVPVSIWNHSLIKDPDSKRAGIGKVWMTDTEFGADIEWDDTPEGKAACKRVEKERPDWSWGFPEPETREPTKEEKAAGIKRVIVSVPVLELSPVDQGAGIAQGTLETCCGSCKSAGSCAHKGKPKSDDGVSCKCAGACSCGRTKEEPKGGDELVDPPDETALDLLKLARLRSGAAPAAGKDTDRERSDRLQSALQEKFGGTTHQVWIRDQMSDEKSVVYVLSPIDGPHDPTPELFRVTWEEGDEGFTFSEPEKVRHASSYQPAT